MGSREERCNVVRTAAWASRSMKRVMRAMCFECMGGTYIGVDECSADKCPLWPFRVSGTRAESFELAAKRLDAEGLHAEATRARTVAVFGGVAAPAEEGETGNEADEMEEDAVPEEPVAPPIHTEPVPVPAGVPKFSLTAMRRK